MDPHDTSRCWLPVVGYENHYEVSDAGRVRSVDRVVRYRDGRSRMHAGQLLEPIVDDRGYHYVSLWLDNKHVKRPVHQLVLEAFVGPRPAGMETLHGNGNPSDNHRTNLRWGTHAENVQDTLRHGRHSMLSKVTCSRGHLLVDPNLVPSDLPNRNCLACNQAHAVANTRADRGGPNRADWIRADADRRYERLMAGQPADQRRIPLDVSNVVDLYRTGLTSAAIAERLGCSAETVLRRLRAAGEPRRGARGQAS